MKCKFCSAEWEGESTVCPECGMDNAPDTELEEAPKKMTPGKIALLAVLAVAAVAVVVALVMGTVKNNKPAEEPTEATTAAEVDSTESGAVTGKSYTAEDAAVVAAHDIVVATMGDHELTNGMFQVYYWMAFYDFMGTYGNYASYFGLDPNAPLDEQESPMGGTWQEYFVEQALTAWKEHMCLVDAANAEGFTLDADTLASLEQIPADLEQSAAANNYNSVEELMLYSMGPGVTVQDYQEYMRDYELSYMFFDSKYSKINPTDDEVAKYFDENVDTFAENGVTKDSYTVDVRHVLLQPVATEDGGSEYTDEAWEDCKVKAEALLKEWQEGEATEDSFSYMAELNSQDPGSASTGGLYTDVEVGQMVAPFEEWCFDETRQPGDFGLVKTDYGYHLMYFVGSKSVWQDKARTALLEDLGSKIVPSYTEGHESVNSYDLIKIGVIPSNPAEN